MIQATSSIFMIRPATFGFNAETSFSNAFQTAVEVSALQEKVWAEFDNMVAQLRMAGLAVFVFEDTPHPKKPDAVFPNNWVSLHADGTLVLYPMLAKNRRLERRMDVLEQLRHDFIVTRLLDLTEAELENRFLEGTGSIVFDHLNKTAFACRSPRTDEKLLQQLCAALGYSPICFDAFDASGRAIYHTNVLLAIGTSLAVCCAEAIPASQRNAIVRHLEVGGRQLIPISQKQMASFAGNMLELADARGNKIILLSETAYQSLSTKQKACLQKHAKLLPIAIPTIEKIGGGSVRCMVAEIFLSKKEKQ
jgi:hypothetical protein